MFEQLKASIRNKAYALDDRLTGGSFPTNEACSRRELNSMLGSPALKETVEFGLEVAELHHDTDIQ